ncbi:MAG: sulfurtransferase TusA family protein [Planktomarina sp.]
MTHTIDAIGLLCPLPVLRLRKALNAAPDGALVTLLADDPASIIDVPHFCAQTGHTLKKAQTEAAPFEFTVQKGNPIPAP